jgi:hypothetical protein
MTKQNHIKTPRSTRRTAEATQHQAVGETPRAHHSAVEQGELKLGIDKKYPPNPETEAFRSAVSEAGRLAAYAAEALVPGTERNRPAVVARVRRDLAADAVAEIIGSGKHKLPDRAKSYTEHAQRKDAVALG